MNLKTLTNRERERKREKERKKERKGESERKKYSFIEETCPKPTKSTLPTNVPPLSRTLTYGSSS